MTDMTASAVEILATANTSLVPTPYTDGPVLLKLLLALFLARRCPVAKADSLDTPTRTGAGTVTTFFSYYFKFIL